MENTQRQPNPFSGIPEEGMIIPHDGRQYRVYPLQPVVGDYFYSMATHKIDKVLSTTSNQLTGENGELYTDLKKCFYVVIEG